MGQEYDLLGSVQEIEIWPYDQMVYGQPKIRSWEGEITFFGILRYKQVI